MHCQCQKSLCTSDFYRYDDNRSIGAAKTVSHSNNKKQLFTRNTYSMLKTLCTFIYYWNISIFDDCTETKLFVVNMQKVTPFL